jgi:hypothetical protein
MENPKTKMQTYSINSSKMNGVLIAFLVLVIIVAIYMVVIFYNPTYLIRDPKSLKIDDGRSSTSLTTKPLNTEQYSTSATELDNPGSNRYYYEGWFYIDMNESIGTENVLFNRGKYFVVTLKGSTLNLYTDCAKDVKTNSGVFEPSGGESPLTSIPNFPFQKWCHLVINVDGLSVDLYIDGKFVKNVKTANGISTNTTDKITYGNQYTTGYVTRFRRMSNNINPQGVWSNYMIGSGQTGSISNYHVNAQITKNKNVRVDQRII